MPRSKGGLGNGLRVGNSGRDRDISSKWQWTQGLERRGKELLGPKTPGKRVELPSTQEKKKTKNIKTKRGEYTGILW